MGGLIDRLIDWSIDWLIGKHLACNDHIHLIQLLQWIIDFN